MDEMLHDRFRRLDRVEAPDLWNEAAGRAAELQLAPRRVFNPTMALIAAALLLAALAGTIAVGAWLDRQAPNPVQVEYENGWLTAQGDCGRVVGIDTATFESRELVGRDSACELADMGFSDPVAWSSDGRWMAYLEPAHASPQTSEAAAIWLYDADSGEAQPVGTCPAYCSGIDISPDGSLVSFRTPDGIAVKEIEGGARHDLELIGVSSTPTFSPDGRQLLFTVTGGQTGIHVVDVAAVMEGADPGRTLVGRIAAVWDPTWSPDGRWIAFGLEAGIRDHETETAWFGSGDTTMTMWVIRPDGSGARQLTEANEFQPIRPPSWSPDSTSIAYLTAGSAEESIALWSVGIDGGPATRLYESGCCVSDLRRPAWSPDGEWITFGVHRIGRPDASGTILIRPDGSEARVVSAQPLDAVWQPLPKEP